MKKAPEYKTPKLGNRFPKEILKHHRVSKHSFNLVNNPR